MVGNMEVSGKGALLGLLQRDWFGGWLFSGCFMQFPRPELRSIRECHQEMYLTMYKKYPLEGRVLFKDKKTFRT